MVAEGSVARGERSGAASQIIECQYPGSSGRPIQSWDRRCFISATATEQALAYVYFEGEPGRARGGEAPHPDVALAYATPS